MMNYLTKQQYVASINNYLDKAVVEMETKQASSLADIFLEDLLELTSDDGFGFRTALLVESP